MEATANMGTLYDYIRYADKTKARAIYTMVEDENNGQINLCEDKDFLKEIDMRRNEYESGNIKTSTWEDVKYKLNLAKKG